MPKCPFCGEEIDELLLEVREYRECCVYLDGYGRIQNEMTYSDAEYRYKCPECNEVLCYDSVDAENFLNGRT